jgi:glycerophosphoryl diester phosphodiesterase
LALRFVQDHGIDPCGIPTLTELFDFVAAYAGPLGQDVGKTILQRERATRLIFDIELKRVPFEPETIGDGFTGSAPALLELQVVQAIRRAGMVHRTRVRSFDHRSVRAIKLIEPTLQTGLLIYETVPADIGGLLAAALADIYCPDYRFVDAEVVGQVRTAGKKIIPYTVNEPSAWERLIAWGVDGITTDYPDRLLAACGFAFAG